LKIKLPVKAGSKKSKNKKKEREMKKIAIFCGVFVYLTGSFAWAVPARVTSLSLTPTQPSTIRFTWTTSAGTPLEIDARISTVPITALNWATRTQLTGEPVPISGTEQSVLATGLLPKTTYYGGLKVRDATGWSLLSNVPFTMTLDTRGQITLVWDPNSESDLAGYMIYDGTDSGSYTYVRDVGNVTSVTFTCNYGETRYYAATAYNTSGFQSGFSNEVVHDCPVP
jgi:hypothetical protein